MPESTTDDVTDHQAAYLSWLWPLLFFFGVTLLFTYPIWLDPAGLVIGRPVDDAFEPIWYLAWYKQALLDLHVSPLFQPDVFYPEGWHLGFAVQPPLYPTLMAPVTAMLGPVRTYNLLLILSTVLAAYGSYLLVRALGGSTTGGLLAGIAYAYYPNRQVYMNGFLNVLLASAWLPWMLLGLVQALNKPQTRGRWLALAAVAYAMSIGGAYQYAYVATFTLLIAGLVLLLPAILRQAGEWLRPLALAALLFLLLAGPQLALGLSIRRSEGVATDFTLPDLIHTSTSLERLLVPSAMNPLFWDLARERFPLRNGEDAVVAFGYVVLALAIVGLVAYPSSRRAKWALVSLALCGLIFMAGPFLTIDGEVVTVPIPALSRFAQDLPELTAGGEVAPIPLPALLVYRLAPPLRSFHHFGRMGAVVILALGTLAGLGLTALQRRLEPRAAQMLGLMAICLLLVEFNNQPLPAVTAIAGMQREVDAWLADQPQQSVIMEYPTWYSFEGRSLYYMLAHEQKIAHGYSIFSPRFLEPRATLDLWPADPAIDLLQSYGVHYVLVHVPRAQTDFETAVLPGLMENDRLRFIGRFAAGGSGVVPPAYLNGRIQPQVDVIKETFLFELVDGEQ
ncbi:MAG: hypothetical protein ACK2UK_12120 [Candidatus Promineifilaceae bacterium]